jgi:hypothetical protein
MRGFRVVTEQLARRTTRRGLFGRGAAATFGALAGAAAGTLARPGGAQAGLGTVCFFPNDDPCPCDACQANGVCAKPCIVWTAAYVSGCWTAGPGGGTVCCDCDCQDYQSIGLCGCGSDYHNNLQFCPKGNASN